MSSISTSNILPYRTRSGRVQDSKRSDSLKRLTDIAKEAEKRLLWNAKEAEKYASTIKKILCRQYKEAEKRISLEKKNLSNVFFILNMNEGNFFSYTKDTGYSKILTELFKEDKDGFSHWKKDDKIVFVPDHLKYYVSKSYGRLMV